MRSIAHDFGGNVTIGVESPFSNVEKNDSLAVVKPRDALIDLCNRSPAGSFAVPRGNTVSSGILASGKRSRSSVAIVPMPSAITTS